MIKTFSYQYICWSVADSVCSCTTSEIAKICPKTFFYLIDQLMSWFINEGHFEIKTIKTIKGKAFVRQFDGIQSCFMHFMGKRPHNFWTVSYKKSLWSAWNKIHECLTFDEVWVQSRVTDRKKCELKTVKRLKIAIVLC